MLMQRCAIKSFAIAPPKLEAQGHNHNPDPLDRQFAGIEVDGLILPHRLQLIALLHLLLLSCPTLISHFPIVIIIVKVDHKFIIPYPIITIEPIFMIENLWAQTIVIKPE